MNKLPFKNDEQGFTLIEILLYIAVAVTILSAAISFFILILQSREKNQTILEVEQQGQQIMEIITQSIRNSEGINSPAAGTNAASVSLDVVTGADDPTIYDLSGTTLQVTEGVAAAIALSNTNVEVSGLDFENLSRPGTPGTIKVQFTLSHVNPGAKNEFDYSQTFNGSASLRY